MRVPVELRAVRHHQPRGDGVRDPGRRDPRRGDQGGRRRPGNGLPRAAGGFRQARTRDHEAPQGPEARRPDGEGGPEAGAPTVHLGPDRQEDAEAVPDADVTWPPTSLPPSTCSTARSVIRSTSANGSAPGGGAGTRSGHARRSPSRSAPSSRSPARRPSSCSSRWRSCPRGGLYFRGGDLGSLQGGAPVLVGDSSNLVVRFATSKDEVVFKSYKIPDVRNREPEILERLHKRQFRHVPRFLGELALGRGPDRLVLGLATERVEGPHPFPWFTAGVRGGAAGAGRAPAGTRPPRSTRRSWGPEPAPSRLRRPRRMPPPPPGGPRSRTSGTAS